MARVLDKADGRSRARKQNGAAGGAADRRDEGGIQSIARAFALLEVVARAANGIGLSDLARSVGLHSSTVFNLLRTMVALGYLWQSPDDKRYRLGRPLFCLAAGAVDDVSLVNHARAVLEDLSRTSGETGHFAVWAGEQVMVLAKTSGAGAFQLSDRGGPRPAHATALGKVLLAALTPAALEDYLARANLVRFTARTITDVRRLRDDVVRVRGGAIALDDAEFHEDVRCIAVPVRDFSGRTVGAIGLSGPVWRMSDDAARERAVLLGAAAQRLSAELGSGGLSESYSPAAASITPAVTTLRKAAPAASKKPGASARRKPAAQTAAAITRTKVPAQTTAAITRTKLPTQSTRPAARSKPPATAATRSVGNAGRGRRR